MLFVCFQCAALYLLIVNKPQLFATGSLMFAFFLPTCHNTMETYYTGRCLSIHHWTVGSSWTAFLCCNDIYNPFLPKLRTARAVPFHEQPQRRVKLTRNTYFEIFVQLKNAGYVGIASGCHVRSDRQQVGSALPRTSRDVLGVRNSFTLRTRLQ